MTEENIEEPAESEQLPSTISKWFKIWIRAITSPTENTYQEIIQEADAKTAVIWLWIAYLITLMVTLILRMTLIAAGIGGGSGVIRSMTFILLFGGCGSALFAFVSAALRGGISALSNAVAKAFGGVGDFNQLFYCTAAYTMPFAIISVVLGLFAVIPFVNILVLMFSFALSIYWVVLDVIAIKAVHQIDVWKAALSSVTVWLWMLMIAACFVIGILTLLDPSIGSVFSNVIEGLDAGY